MSKETKLKAFEFTKEWATQLITVASAILVLSATFYKDMIGGVPACPRLLEGAWFLFLMSIIFGILVLSSLVGNLNVAVDENELDAYSGGIRATSMLQIVLFGAGLLCFTLFVAANMKSRQSESSSNKGTVLEKSSSSEVQKSGSTTRSAPSGAVGEDSKSTVVPGH